MAKYSKEQRDRAMDLYIRYERCAADVDWLQCIRPSDEGRMTWDWRPTMVDPKHPRHHDEAFKRQIVQSCESGKPSREIRAEYDPAAPGPRHPRQRLRPGRGQPHARAERTGRAGEAQQAVGDGGGRFRTSGAGIRTKAGVIRANAARYPISARCGIPGVPRSTCYWMTGHPGTERADPIAGDVRAVRRDGRERYGARKIKAALERRGVTASRRRIGLATMY